MIRKSNFLKLKWLGIDTHYETVVYLHKDCHICRSEGFESQARIKVSLNGRSILATLNSIESNLLGYDEASLSNSAWQLLGAKEGDEISLAHPEPLETLPFIRAKIYDHELDQKEMTAIIQDIVSGNLSDIQIATFLTASAGGRLNEKEILELTRAMIKTGTRLEWPSKKLVVDKHSIGGLPGNRTTLILVPIVAAFGLTIPKTSSRSITSPAGTADTMEVFAPVNLDLANMKRVVEEENGCIVWGDSVGLSPADDILIRIERVVDLDSEGQMIASVLSKKIAAGSNHIAIDMPIGPTAKVRTMTMANLLKEYFETVGKSFGVVVRIFMSDGSEPVGRGIGPALEAKDILAVLTGAQDAPQDLRDRALTLAGHILEFSPQVKPSTGKKIAQEILDSGDAWKKFQAICRAQGGMFEIPKPKYKHTVLAESSGRITKIDNRRLARVAKLAGAPQSKAAGVELLTSINTQVEINQPLYIVHAETKGELHYALAYLKREKDIVYISDSR